ncbi:MAG: hypothetical protein WC449_06085 [Candidatus Paceibacterota bacterium]
MKDIDFYSSEEPEIKQPGECKDKGCYFFGEGCMTSGPCTYEENLEDHYPEDER